MYEKGTTSRLPRFLSLKWKVILLLSLVLLITDVAIILFADSRAREQFHQEQEQTMHRLFHTLNRQLQASNTALGRVASLVPLLEVHSLARDAGVGQRLEKVLLRHGAALELEWDISLVRFVESAGSAGAGPEETGLPDALLALAQQAERSGEQAAILSCMPDCYQYVATPLIEDSGSGVLLLGRSIADLVLEFHRLSDAQIAFLGPEQGNPDSPRVAAWRSGIMAVSQPGDSLPLIRALAMRFSVEQLMAAPRLLNDGDGWYLAQMHGGQGANYRQLIIYPVSTAIRELEARRHDTIYIGLGGLLVAELLMLLLLWSPMDRLRALVAVLPDLGHGRHRAFASLPRVRSGSRVASDEIDLLARSIGELIENLRASHNARDEAEKHLLWLANHDSLTNLYNRRYFQQEFDQILTRAQRYRHQGALLYLDLDQFKNINDLSGHQAGDRLLQQVATELRRNVRETDVLARLGGDEFALLLPECDPRAAVHTAEKILKQLKQVHVAGKEHVHRISTSIGIALFPQHGGNAGDLMANADLAMYRAKEAGRNRCYLFSSSDQAREHLDLRTRFQDKINNALDSGGFYLEYQPVLDIRTRQVVRHEALIRLREPDGSVVPPDRFIGVAEYTGQIRDIDRWVVSQVLAHLRGDSTLRLAVNLSGAVIDDPQMHAWLKETLPPAGLRPGQLTIELTETAMVSNVLGAVEFMRDVRVLGAEFALDDFGSGFASYAYLKQLPVDYVKIDGSFIQDLANNPDDQLFIKALVEVAHGLGKKTVAEYVEDAQTLELLEKYGVDFAQGYYIGRPAGGFSQMAWVEPG